ncbi:hypothetical protein FHR24_000560 [Wenyingzhuangia heitensis]|uniref:SbsA Ig-like domain-containing protein n=1 Tax=Wenyingzhuangia heitensis TaxID=1487859 RepID=A0ABX0U940_9FLAO|nr:Ig-like domain-containing protein [Wenyingzhuangia heitensis]NIJ44121.1 hypothetical protein [Wenyingzhuangia heitensis]
MRKLLVFIIVILALKTSSCARMGSPDGGPKDSIPPVMAIAKPMNKTTSFKQQKIVILFDEYIKFEKLNSQLIISPPMEKKPEIKPLSGVSKKITIEFLDSLAPNTTYTINFGNSIVDNNEGNELGRFSYVFSTGTFLDSLSVAGKIIDPLDEEEVENISIMAYKNANDTLIGNYTPNYLTNTLKSNIYQLENLSEANYKVIALEDKNNNYKYDKGIERIGFIDHSIDLNTPIDSIDFILFKELKDNRIYSPKQTSGNQLIIGYQGNKIPSIQIKGTTPNNYLISKQPTKDSLYIWFKELVTDSLYIKVEQDTLIENYTYKLRELKKDSLELQSLIKSVLHPNDSLKFSTNNPVNFVNNDSIQLFESDSIPVSYKVISDNKKHQLWIDFERETNKNYSLILKDHAFTDFFDTKNHYKKINFSTQDSEEYGDIILDISNPNNINLIVELYNTKSKYKSTQITNSSTKISFTKLEPKEYRVRIIKDFNKNNQFDNGNFNTQTQPEIIYNFPKIINLRANSEINENISVD